MANYQPISYGPQGGGNQYVNAPTEQGKRIQQFILTDPGVKQILHAGEQVGPDGVTIQPGMSGTFLKDRKQKLLAYLQQHGMWGDDLTLDDQGNVWNTDALDPTGKALLIASTIAATAGIGASFAAPALAGGAASGSDLAAGPSVYAAGAAPSVAGGAGTLGAAVAPGAAAAGGGASVIPAVAGASATSGWLKALGPIIGAGTSLAGAAINAHTANQAGQQQADASKYAADLQAKAAADALDFTKAQEATRAAEFASTQSRNYDIYKAKQALLAPYVNAGQGAIGQLAQPIPGVGTIGQLVGGR